MSDRIIQKPGGISETVGRDGLDRLDGHGLPKCMACAGAGVLQDGLDRFDGHGLRKCMACAGAGVLQDGLDRLDGHGLPKCMACAGAGVLQDGLDRFDGHGLPKWMACAGAGVHWTVKGGPCGVWAYDGRETITKKVTTSDHEGRRFVAV